MKPRWWFLLDEAPGDTPASTGGAHPAGSDVDWVSESSPDPDDVPAAATTPTPTPASTPSTPTPTPAATPSTSSPAPTPAATPATPAPATPAAPVASTTPTATTPTPTPTAPVAPTTPTPAPVEPPPVAETPPAAPDLAALRTAEVTRLTGVFASRINDDVARGLLVEPAQHLPAILANLQVDTMDAVVQHIYANLPSLIQTLTARSTEAQQNEQAFFTAWPALNKPEYKQTVENAIRGYRQLNPKAHRDEVIRAAGLTAMITHRLPLPQELFAPTPTPTPAPVAAPFVHAAPGGAAPVPAPAGQTNAFTLLNEEYDREERG